MDRRTTQHRSPQPRHANPVLVLELEDVELLEETFHQTRRGDRYPPAISDDELRLLVDVCTYELCELGAYRYGR